MRRQVAALALSALLATSVGASPAAAEGTLTPVESLPGVVGPSATNGLLASDDGHFLVGGATLIDGEGEVIQHFDGAGADGVPATASLRSDSRAVLRNNDQLLVVDLATGEATARPDPGVGTYLGAEGWVGLRTGTGVDTYVFHSWEGSQTELIPATYTEVRLDRGRALIPGRDARLNVMDVASGEAYSIAGVPGDSQWRTSERGVSWASLTQSYEAPAARQWCHADWGATEGVCTDYTWERPAGTARTVLPGATALFVVADDGISVFAGGSWRLAPIPAGSTASGCRIDDEEVVCMLKGPETWWLWRVGADAVDRLVPVPDSELTITAASLTPTAVYGTDDRRYFWPEQGVWRQDLTGGAQPVPLLAGRTVLAQGARAVVGTQWHLDDEPGVELDAAAVEFLSGPYAVATGTGWYSDAVFGPDGTRRYGPNRAIHAIFGTNVLEPNGIYDLTTGLRVRELWADSRHKLWGAWILRDNDSVENWATGVGAELAVPSQHWGSDVLLGDGIAILQGRGDDRRNRALIYDLSRIEQGKPLVAALDLSVRVLALDGNRIAWTEPDDSRTGRPDGDIHISVLPFGGTSEPYFLGSTAAGTGLAQTAPWRTSFDFTRDVTPGTLTIRDWTGRVVRTLPTPASRAGIIRDVVWDVRDQAGAVVADGPYTWEISTTDAQGRTAKGSDTRSAVTGNLTVGTGLIPVTAPTPKFVDACGDHADTYTLAAGQGFDYKTGTTVRAPGTYTVGAVREIPITAVARPGYRLTGTTSWTFAPSPALCSLSLPGSVKYQDLPGTANDTYTLPGPSPHVIGWMVNGRLTPAGTYPAKGTYTFEPLAERGYDTFGIVVQFTDVPEPTAQPFDVYTNPGTHLYNGRTWDTRCEPYSQTQRCRTQIMASTVVQKDGKFTVVNGWVFNNLTYLPMARSAWKGNPLGGNGEVGKEMSWTAMDGRQWRTQCDTAVTGRGGCRSYVRASLIVTEPVQGGGSRYLWDSRWILNNMVRFS
ncbi:hypothetical protein LKO27_09840 [Tessaracoccus sp. OS52]|uniref:FlgD immunoglobulin-like domain containing protein n=1 Tax=Tessaracoccus sp. OS52 TaxID=2886691 RepID=UPI001D11E4B9|nr:FlgD immunoglobulin-like domain containing protein [Tessaracoccus sp. OS52]MCC2593704.1 hypothetical protein [Tessaracoccus sp. OS52]